MQKSLRPETFTEFIGQKKLISTISVMIASAKARKTCLDHILFYGGPGLGKTSLAMIIASETNSPIKFAQGPMLEKKADMLALFGSLSDGQILFVDEIHRINKSVEELLYPALEDGFIDITIGVEGESKIMRMKLPAFTFIGATTKISRLSLPLKDRFGLIGKLGSYSVDDMFAILTNSKNVLSLPVTDDALRLVASHSRLTPRVANNLLKRVYDFFCINKWEIVDVKKVKKIFSDIGLYRFGLDQSHIDYLKILNEVKDEKWIAVSAIVCYVSEEKDMIEQEIEPPLLHLGFVEKSSRGRRITKEGMAYILNYHFYS